MSREVVAVACNYAAGTKIARDGARCYLLWRTGGDNRRCQVLVKSRGGRWVTKWEPIVMLDHFRLVRVPEARVEFARLSQCYAADHTIGTVSDLDDIVACRIAALGEPRWRRLLEKRASPTPPAAPRSPASSSTAHRSRR